MRSRKQHVICWFNDKINRENKTKRCNYSLASHQKLVRIVLLLRTIKSDIITGDSVGIGVFIRRRVLISGDWQSQGSDIRNQARHQLKRTQIRCPLHQQLRL